MWFCHIFLVADGKQDSAAETSPGWEMPESRAPKLSSPSECFMLIPFWKK